MAQIIMFPGKEKRWEREVDQIIDELLNVSDPALHNCIKRRVGHTLKTKRRIPPIQLEVTLPPGVTAEEIEPIVNAFQEEYINVVSEFGRELIKDICLLQVQLCRAELSNQK